MTPSQRIIVGITGASGAVYGVRLLQALRTLPQVEIHLVVTDTGWRNLHHETQLNQADVTALAHHTHDVRNVGAHIASGSFQTSGMVVAPCSMRTVAAIAHSLSDNLLTRAADVVLKERRRLVLMVRETPLHTGHVRNMLALCEMGAVIAPPVPAFYAAPATIADMVDHTLGRVLDLFGLESGTVRRWGEAPSGAAPVSASGGPRPTEG